MTLESWGYVAEIEQDVLGGILAGGDHRGVLSELEDDCFLEPIHREIMAAIRVASERYGTTALPTVAKLIPKETLESFKRQTGGELGPYLAGIVGQRSLGGAMLIRGARAVKSQWARIEMGLEVAAATEAARDPQTDHKRLAVSLMGTLDEIAARAGKGARTQTCMAIGDAVGAALDEAREARARGGLGGITTGLVDLDRATGGFHRRDLAIMAARPSMGKTTIGIEFARAAAMAGHGVGFFSLEMDNAKLGARFASSIANLSGTRVPYQDIIKGDIGEAQERAIEGARERFRDLPIILEDQSGLTMAQMRAKTESMLEAAERQGCPMQLLLVDHLGKVKPSTRYAGNRNNEIGEITDGLKELAREYEIAVVLLSQLSRGVESREDKRPGLMDLRDSGNIEQDADSVFFLYREAYYLERARPDDPDKRIEWEADLSAVRNAAELIIGKQRNGPTCTIDLFMDMAVSSVGNATRAHEAAA
ncbi:replicative DNA helicase [Pelagibacterium luteolum]|uniref:Replicative DNA helicase n=1 Tax=Pelagibacterium luteolum TaxID=440168 RepID=A0A1G7S7C5_9HYPH|nr:DnaB-like helicase C-terminal domain-containing protein [Pelagibacterium luteolum]SDG18842.1 replicative DNA helicase [Pelagibacterium luteolum]